jgi:hypothetical protein
MADYFTHFSCIFDVGTAENAQAAFGIRDALAEELESTDGCEPGFEMLADPDAGPGVLWIHGDGYGEPDHVVRFVLACAEAFALTGRWGFVWSLTCSKPCLDGFGGGAQLLDLGTRRALDWIDCHHWLAAALAPEPDTAAPSDA